MGLVEIHLLHVKRLFLSAGKEKLVACRLSNCFLAFLGTTFSLLIVVFFHEVCFSAIILYHKALASHLINNFAHIFHCS